MLASTRWLSNKGYKPCLSGRERRDKVRKKNHRILRFLIRVFAKGYALRKIRKDTGIKKLKEAKDDPRNSNL